MNRNTLLGVVLLAAFLAAASASCVPAVSPLKQVTFTYSPDRHYERVFLAGTFNEWSTDATEMRRTADGFEVTLPLAEGTYQYKFVADGQWITDETATSFNPDGYGGQNSVIDVDDSFPALDIERGDGRIMADGISHGRNAWERSLNRDGSVTLRVRAWAGDVELVELVLKADTVCSLPPVGPSDTDGTYDYFEVTVDSLAAAAATAYAFHILDGSAGLWLGGSGISADAAGAGWFDMDLSSMTMFSTPDWVKEGVIYQIFPERFANGDRSNDPDFTEWYYEGVRELPPSGKTNGEYFHMVDDWYDVAGLKRSPYKTDGKPDWNSFYGGDIAGIRKNLDYLESLGVTIIYLNPIFKSKSNHKYDAASYMEIDPHFGTNDEFKAFVDECHGRGIRVIIDLAINHTGHTYWAFVDGREKGTQSEYWDWYEWKEWPVPGGIATTPADPLDYYDCWWGFGQMPDLNFDLSRPNGDEQSAKDVADAEPNMPLVEHLLDVAEYWLADEGVDGYRLDVAGEVPFWFWKLFRERVHEVNPDAYIVGELWGASPEWVNGNYFDAVMNYKFFRDPVLRFLCRGESTAEQFDRELAPGRLIYPEEGVLAQMNLIDSHDTERYLTTAGGDIRRLRLAALFSMTYVGVPTIYYGDEVGMVGGGDPDCRRPFDWRWSRDGDKARLHNTYARLASLRKRFPVLVRGGFETLLTDGKVYAFRRRDDSSEVVVVINAGTREATVVVPLGPDVYSGPLGQGLREFKGMNDLLDGSVVPVSVSEDGLEFELTLPPLSGSLYVPRLMTTGPTGAGN